MKKIAFSLLVLLLVFLLGVSIYNYFQDSSEYSKPVDATQVSLSTAEDSKPSEDGWIPFKICLVSQPNQALVFDSYIPSFLEPSSTTISKNGCLSPTYSDSWMKIPNFVLESKNKDIFANITDDLNYIFYVERKEDSLVLNLIDLKKKKVTRIDDHPLTPSSVLDDRIIDMIRVYSPQVSREMVSVLGNLSSSGFLQVKNDKYVVYSWFQATDSNRVLYQNVRDVNGQLVFRAPNDCEIVDITQDFKHLLYRCNDDKYFLTDFVVDKEFTFPYGDSGVGLNKKHFTDNDTIEFYTSDDQVSRGGSDCKASVYNIDLDGKNLKYIGRTPACM